MKSFYNVIDSIKTAVSAEPFNNNVSFGDITDIDLSKQTIFPLAHIMVNNMTVEQQYVSFNVTLFLMDLVDVSNEQVTDLYRGNDNRQDILNTQLAVVNRLIEKLRSGTLHQNKYQLDGSPSCEPFVDRFENKIAGWATTLDILIHNDIYIC